MIISRTPFRISFFGGGTDYPSWYRTSKEGGAVLSTTIDKYCYLSARYFPAFFDTKHRIVWSHIENVSSIREILHPVIREGLKHLGFDDERGLEIHYQADLPARAGMGSSSAFTVGFINAMYGLRGLPIDRHRTALQAIELEQDVLKEHVGSQDQVAVSYGGFNVIRFLPDGEIRVEPLAADPERMRALESKLMLFYLNAGRFSSDVASQVVKDLSGQNDRLCRMRDMVDTAAAMLRGRGNIDDFGALLHDAWMHKRELSAAISNPAIDAFYETARKNGAIGGKLLGAGKTGFMVFYVPEEAQAAVKQALSPCLHVPFRFEANGSTLVSYA